MLYLQVIGTLYEKKEGLGGGEEGEEDYDDDSDRPKEPETETDLAPPPDHDPDDDDDNATVILDEGEEEPEEEGAGRGHVDPAGATETIPASVSSEVRAAIKQAHLVSEGLAPPAKTINIAPLPGLQSPAPQGVPPTAGLMDPRALSQQDRALIKDAVDRVFSGPQRHSSRSRGPAPGSSGTPRTTALPQPPPPPPQQPAPQPQGLAIPLSTGGSWLPPALPAGCSVGCAPPGVTLPTQKRLSDTPLGLRGYKWRQCSRPYIPWAPTTVQLWEAYRLLRGEGEWVAPRVCYISEGSSRRSAAKPSLRWECTLCPQLVSCTADGRGHHQSSHLGGQCSSPPLQLSDSG